MANATRCSLFAVRCSLVARLRSCYRDPPIAGGGVQVSNVWIALMALLMLARCGPATDTASPDAPPAVQVQAAPDSIPVLVGRLDLERYKATIKGLTQFGDRLHGTDRNRAAVDWIETQLKSYGCATERFIYEYPPPEGPADVPPAAPAVTDPPRAVGGGRPRGIRVPTSPPLSQAEALRDSGLSAQQDARLRELNAQASVPGPRQQVYCTKVGTTRPDEMYIISAHMDGRGYGEAANDDASGTALVMELARTFSGPDVETGRSIRFILWNNEETGLNGARAYVEEREALQGKENPAGSGRYPEPKWLGVIQHDMMLFDHGAPRADGTVSAEQRPEADVNIEFQSNSKMAEQSQALAWAIHAANEKYAGDYPASVGNHMTNTDSSPFQDVVAAVSLRENERGVQIGSGWDPHWHQPTDIFANFNDKDFLLGLNAAQTTLGAVAALAGTRLKE